MNRKKTYLTIILILFISYLQLNAQDTIKGIVVNSEDGHPIPNVVIIESRNSASTISDSEGSFKLEIKEFPTIFYFSHLSFESQSSILQQNTQRILTFELEPKLIDIEEVFVLGNRLQKFFQWELFSVKDYVITENIIWVIGYVNNNIRNLEIRALKLSGDIIARKIAGEKSNLFLDAYNNVHEVSEDNIKQLSIVNDSIVKIAEIIEKDERDVLLNVVAYYDSLAFIQRINPIGTYKEYVVFDYRDSSRAVFHEAYDHSLFASTNQAINYKHGAIPDIIFPPFQQALNWDPSDAFTKYSEERLMIYKKINSQLFIYNDTIVVYQKGDPQFSVYSKDLKYIKSYNLDLHKGRVFDRINSEKLQTVQKDRGSGKVYLFTSKMDNINVSDFNPIKGEILKATNENGLRYVSNVKVYNNRIYFIRQSPLGSRALDLFSIPFE